MRCLKVSKVNVPLHMLAKPREFRMGILTGAPFWELEYCSNKMHFKLAAYSVVHTDAFCLGLQ